MHDLSLPSAVTVVLFWVAVLGTLAALISFAHFGLSGNTRWAVASMVASIVFGTAAIVTAVTTNMWGV